MTLNMRLAAWAFGILAIALAVAYGALAAAYLLAGVAFAVILGLMVSHAGRAIGDWHLGHPVRIAHRHKGERRAA